MKSRFIISAYCSGLERSSPNWWRTAATVSGVGLRPASERVGATPGVAKKIRNVSTVISHRTARRLTRRRATKTSPRPLALDAELRPRVERVADAVAEHVERQHRQHDHDPRRDPPPRPAVEEVLAVVDDRAPARLGRLHPDRQERQRRLGEDRRGDKKRKHHDQG